MIHLLLLNWYLLGGGGGGGEWIWHTPIKQDSGTF